MTGVFYKCCSCASLINSIDDCYMVCFYKPKGTWRHGKQKVVMCTSCSTNKLNINFK